MNKFKLSSRLVLCALVCCVWLVTGSNLSYSDDGWGEFDGAIWRVTLTPQIAMRGPKKEKAVRLSGRYRVEKLVLYQSEDRKDKELGRKVGKSHPVADAKKPTTIVELSEFEVHNREENRHMKISGKAKLFKEPKEQKAKGVFVEDEGGWKWDMEIVRVRE